MNPMRHNKQIYNITKEVDIYHMPSLQWNVRSIPQQQYLNMRIY